MKRKKIGVLLIILGIVYTFLYLINAFNSYAFISIPSNETFTISRIGLYLVFAGILVYSKTKVD